MRSQRVLILAERAESGALSRFFGLFEHGRAYEVLAAENRREAVSAMKRGRPDLIVLDPRDERDSTGSSFSSRFA